MTAPTRTLDFTSANWPDRAQLCLLQACLLSGPAAIAAWREWQRLVRFDEIDLASQRLVPLLHHNLSRLGVPNPDAGRYQGLQRLSWYLNQVKFQRGAWLLRQFADAKIPTLVLKGAALAHLYYPDTSLRPMNDFDVLVPPAQAAAAVALLPQWGFQPQQYHCTTLNLRPFSTIHAWSFTGAEGGELDLHWRALRTSFGPEADEVFWAGAVTFKIAGVSARTLNATDQLLHACVHGMAVNDVAPMRWVADAIMILRRAEIDWDRLLAQTSAQGISVIMNHALAYLQEHFEATVPDRVFHDLARIPAARWEKREFALITRPGSWARRWNGATNEFLRMRWMNAALSTISLPHAYSLYLQHRWNLETTAAIPGYLWHRLQGKLTRRLRRARQHGVRGKSPEPQAAARRP